MRDNHDKQLDLNLLLSFEVLFQECSVTRAAEKMGVTQSAMSRTLKRLREFYEDPLFVRSGDTMRPTPYAEHLSKSVSEMMTLVRNRLVSVAHFQPDTTDRTFSLCLTDMGELVFLPPLIKKLKESAPHCRLRTMQVATDQIPAMLESGEIDLAIGTNYVRAPAVFQQELFQHNFICIVSGKSELDGDTLTLERFERMKHVAVILSDRTRPYDAIIDDLGVKRRIFLTTNHFLTIPIIIEDNLDLIATVPIELGRFFSRFGSVKMIPPPLELPTFPLRQYWHPRHHNDEANIWLRRLIKETFDSFS